MTLEAELAALQQLPGDLGKGGVAVLVEAPGTQDATVSAAREELPDHTLAGDLAVGIVGPLDCVEQHVGRLVAVDGVRLDAAAEPLLVVRDEVLARLTELADGQAAEGCVDALASVPGRLDKGILHYAVWAHEDHALVRHPGPDLVGDELTGVVLGDAAEVDGVGVGLRYLGH